jgi:hypothetical protein
MKLTHRSRLDSLEQELRQMRQELRFRRPSTLSDGYPEPIGKTNDNSSADVTSVDQIPSPTIKAETINGIELSPNVILALVEEYVLSQLIPTFLNGQVLCAL